jgi:hypothetical protein
LGKKFGNHRKLTEDTLFQNFSASIITVIPTFPVVPASQSFQLSGIPALSIRSGFLVATTFPFIANKRTKIGSASNS